jgi:hypothetical protein
MDPDRFDEVARSTAQSSLMQRLTGAAADGPLDRRSLVRTLFGATIAAALFGTEAGVADARSKKHRRRRRRKNRKDPANAVGCIGCAVGDVCYADACCTPEGKVWCELEDRKCGPWRDNCGQPIDCGTCPNGQYCIEFTGTCSLTPPCPATTCPAGSVCVEGSCCTPDPASSCQSIGRECGFFLDNCDQKTYCGACGAGQLCGYSTGKCEDSFLCLNPCSSDCCDEGQICRGGQCTDDANGTPMYADPKPLGQVSSLRPTISVVMSDDEQLGPSAITMLVDGVKRQIKYDLNTGVISWTPSSNLSLGAHKVKVITRDSQGRVAEIEWEFGVVTKPDTTPPTITSIDSKIVNGRRTRTIVVQASDRESGIASVSMRFCKTPTSNAKTCWDNGGWLRYPYAPDKTAPYELSGDNIPTTGTYWVVARVVNKANQETLRMRRFSWTSAGFTPDSNLNQ